MKGGIINNGRHTNRDRDRRSVGLLPPMATMAAAGGGCSEARSVELCLGLPWRWAVLGCFTSHISRVLLSEAEQLGLKWCAYRTPVSQVAVKPGIP